MTEAEISVGRMRLWLCAMVVLCAGAMALPAAAAAWANEDAMRFDENAANRDTFIYDPGWKEFISRSKFVSSPLKSYYVKKGFDANFLNWAKEDELPLGSALWAGCHVGKHTEEPCPSAIEFGPVNGDVATGVVTALHSETSAGFIATVCGNYSKASGTATPPKVTGVKYEDLNANGKQDPGDPGLSGWTIRLIHGGKVVATTTTGSGGKYSFTLDAKEPGITFGTYKVEEISKAGWVAEEKPAAFEVPPGSEGEVFKHKDFGNFRPAEIAGHKFDDSNVSGERDGEEVGLEGWKISLSNGDHQLTDSAGAYSFSVRPGKYTVGEQLKEGWRQTFPGGEGTHTYTVISGQVVDDADFGNVCLGSATISAVDDSTEEPVSMEVRLEEKSAPGILENEPSLPRTMTGSEVTFGKLLPGEYRVVAFLPKGFYTIDPDVQPVEGRFAIVKTITVPECEEVELELHLVSQSTPGKVTGGIVIERPEGFATGGFVFMTQPPEEPLEPPVARGILQFNEHKQEEELILHTKIVKLIHIEGDEAQIWGEVPVGETLEVFHLVLVDAGEPGTDDRFELTLANGYEAGQDETLIGGNVQIHPPQG